MTEKEINHYLDKLVEEMQEFEKQEFVTWGEPGASITRTTKTRKPRKYNPLVILATVNKIDEYVEKFGVEGLNWRPMRDEAEAQLIAYANNRKKSNVAHKRTI